MLLWVPEGLGSLISNTSRLPETFDGYSLAFSLTDIFDTIGVTLMVLVKKLVSLRQIRKTMSQLNWTRLYSVTWFAASVGAIAGTSSVTTYVESAAVSVLVGVLV